MITLKNQREGLKHVFYYTWSADYLYPVILFDKLRVTLQVENLSVLSSFSVQLLLQKLCCCISAVYNFKPNGQHQLQLDVGDTVHILEETTGENQMYPVHDDERESWGGGGVMKLKTPLKAI